MPKIEPAVTLTTELGVIVRVWDEDPPVVDVCLVGQPGRLILVGFSHAYKFANTLQITSGQVDTPRTVVRWKDDGQFFVERVEPADDALGGSLRMTRSIMEDVAENVKRAISDYLAELCQDDSGKESSRDEQNEGSAGEGEGAVDGGGEGHTC